MRQRAWLALLIISLVACGQSTAPGAEDPVPAGVAAAAETAPTAQDGANGVAIWVNPADPARSLILGAGGTGGLEVYGLDGALRQRIADIEASHVVVRSGFDIGGKPRPLVLVYEPVGSSLHGFTIDAAGKLGRLPGKPLLVDDELTGLCEFRSPISGRVYALGMTDSGQMLQWELFDADGALQGRLVRSVPLGKGVEYCVVDDASATMYYGDEMLGVMNLPVEPETDAARKAFDFVQPHGGITEEVKGLALAQGADGARQLVVSDVSAERFSVYGLDGKLQGRFQITAGKGVDAVGESEGLALATTGFGAAWPEGLLVVADRVNDGAASNFKLVGWRELRSALNLAETRAAAAVAGAPDTARTVSPALETPAVATWGDAADDPAIWVNPRDPSRSVVIGTDKNLGLYVYDVEGRLLQTLPDGRMNNVDLRGGFVVNGKPRTLVAASNRTTKTISLYWLDPATRKLSSAGDAVPIGFDDPYGLCMYAAPDDGGHFVFVNNGGDGRFRQWRITADGDLAVAERVREFAVGSQAEGCAADDETGDLYVAEEAGGFWKYSAAPDGAANRKEIDRVDGANGLVADIEGVAIWYGRDGSGYVVLSNQGADSYAVYRREGDNAFVGLFHIVADPERGLDGVSETDGLDVVSQPLGPAFPEGLLVVQDGRNLTPRERQNFKYVSWRDIARALGIRE
ncbi:MAG: phytase [Steroidobacteraceae bacterium]